MPSCTFDGAVLMRRAGLVAVTLAVAACGGQRPGPVTPAPDSVAAAARRDSLLAAARRDSLSAAARRDSIAAALRADSAARVAREASVADSVRAQVQRNATEDALPVASGLDSATSAELTAMVAFEFDRAELSEAAIAALDRKLRILEANARVELQVAGHCDERGADEYNLALGERRAAAVKRYLVERGIADRRIAILSYGEERPLDPGHTDEAWARNRRAEFAVTAGAR